MSETGPILVLFDIDGTLVDLHGAGRRAFTMAIAETFGWNDSLDYISFAGATDLDVLRQICKQHGYTCTPSDEHRFFVNLPKHLQRATDSSSLTILPGVIDLVARLSDDPGYLVGLVTGNIEPCAKIKLEVAGIHGSFLIGAFGHEHADRMEIARLALARAQAKVGKDRFLGQRFLIGDTPADIQAAHTIGAKAIAVATGHYSIDDLRQANANLAVSGLDEREVWRYLGLPG
ncbi:MAG TPA: HAD hydrolase-like protein [Pirellulaceae bacterium]|nr:HAD hydrolase-like protein [Pirellulaceae bacterium]